MCVCVCELDVWSCARLGSCQKSTQASTLRSDKNTSSHTDILTHTRTLTHTPLDTCWKCQKVGNMLCARPAATPPTPTTSPPTSPPMPLLVFWYFFISSQRTPPAERIPPKRAKKVAKPLKPFDWWFFFLDCQAAANYFGQGVHWFLWPTPLTWQRTYKGLRLTIFAAFPSPFIALKSCQTLHKVTSLDFFHALHTFHWFTVSLI